MAGNVLALVLLAAVLHAVWNAMIKSSGDRLMTIASVALASTVTGAVLVAVAPAPDPASWPYIGLSAAIHVGYYLFLFHAYRVGDLSQVYPIARGTAPVIVCVAAWLLAGETLSWPALAGVGCASLGIMSIAFLDRGGRALGRAPLLLAFGTGLIIATYTVVDGIGVRLSGAPLGYIGWLFLLEFPVVLFALARRRGQFTAYLVRTPMTCAGAGLTSVTAYGLVLYAVNFAPMASVSALRETSVIFAAMIGTFILGERPWQRRVAAATAVAGGVALLTTYG